MRDRLPLLLIVVFGVLGAVPLLFAELLGNLALYIQPGRARITLFILSAALFIIFLFTSVFVQTLMLAAARLLAHKKFGLLEIFSETRTHYWRTFLYDVYAGLLLLIPLLPFFFYDLAGRWAIGAGWVLLVLYAYVFIRAPLLLPKRTAWGAIRGSVQGSLKKHHVTLFFGVLGFAAIPAFAWFAVQGFSMDFVLLAISQLYWLLNSITFYFPIYVTLPATILWRLGLLVFAIAYLVAAYVWMHKQELRK